jgi:hypothetical protein
MKGNVLRLPAMGLADRTGGLFEEEVLRVSLRRDRDMAAQLTAIRCAVSLQHPQLVWIDAGALVDLTLTQEHVGKLSDLCNWLSQQRIGVGFRNVPCTLLALLHVLRFRVGSDANRVPMEDLQTRGVSNFELVSQ